MREGYKISELGEIPVEWELNKIEDICNLRNEKFNPVGNENKKYVALEHMGQGTGRIIGSGNSNETTSLKTIFKTNDILFGKLRSYLRKYWFCKFEGVCATEILPLYAKEGVDPKYCFYIIQQDKFIEYTDQGSFGTKMPRTSWNDIKKFVLPVPTLKEQQKIAEILSTVDDQIEQTEGLLEKTKKLKKGLLQRLLTKGIGHTDFKKTEVGVIPKEWEIKKLVDVSKFNNGKSHEQNISEFGIFIVVNSKFISSEGKIRKYTNDNVCPLEKRDIVIVMSDLPNGRALGKCYLIETDNLYSLNQRIGSLKALGLDSVYLFYYLNRNRYFLKYDDGVKQTNLRKSEVLGCPILIPCFNEQKQIASILSSVDEKIEQFEAKKEKLQQLKQGLMQKLLTGKIIVNMR